MSDLLNPIARAWWSWMGPMLWQASLLIVIVGGLDLLLRRWAWPRVRYAVWSLVLVKLLLPPSWSLPTGLVPHARHWVQETVATAFLGGDTASPGVKPTESGTGTPTVGSRDGGSLGRPIPPGEPTSGSEVGEAGWQTAALGVWIFGMLVMGGFLWLRIATLRRWHREQKERGTIPPWFHELMVTTAERLALDRIPAIVFSEKAVTPAVYGVLRPTLLLPRHYTDSLTPEEAEHVLLHELAHIKRGDLWVNALCLLLQIVYWFNPFVAWTRRQVKHVRELCCDLTIANVLRERTAAYRATLLNTARRLLTETLEPAMGLLGVFEEPYRLVSRLRWLEGPSWRHNHLSTVTSYGVFVILAPLLIPMATTWPVAPAAEPTTASAPEVSSGGKEVYIREITRIEDAVLGLTVRTLETAVSEMWIGDDVIAGREDGRTVIVDRRRSAVTVVDHASRTYAEAPLPLDRGQLIEATSEQSHERAPTSGRVQEVGEGKTVLGRRCRVFEVSLWHLNSDAAPSYSWVWVTDDVPFDLTLYADFLDAIRTVDRRDESLRRELAKMPGFQARHQINSGSFLTRRHVIAETVEISRRAAPPDVFAPPAGYHKVERLRVD